MQPITAAFVLPSNSPAFPVWDEEVFQDNVHGFDRYCGDRRRRRPGHCAMHSYPRARARPQPAPGQPGYGYYPPSLAMQPGYGQQGYGQRLWLPGPAGTASARSSASCRNRYNVNDGTAVQQCASAAMSKASAQYRPQNDYGNAYGYNNNAATTGLRPTYARDRHHQCRAP